MSQRRNPFARMGTSPTPSPGPSPGPTGSTGSGRPKSALFPSQQQPLSNINTGPVHTRTQSSVSINTALHPTTSNGPRHHRDSSRNATPNSATFAPSFIKTEDLRKSIDVVKGIEGENDFSGKRYVWLRDPQTAFVKGWVVEELGEGRILVQCDDGSVSPPKSHRSLILILSAVSSNERSTKTAWIRSTPPSSTRRTIWPN